jgi:hypothetical protein
VHGKKLMHGWLNRLPLFNQTFGENIPLIRMLKRPESIPHGPLDTSLASQASDIIQLFKLRYIVLHKDYLPSEAVDRIDTLLRAVLPVRLIAEDRHIVAFQTVLEGGDQMGPRNAYEVDFGSEYGLPVLLDGWSTGESSEGRTFAWSNAQESSVWLYLPQVSNMKMDLHLSPFRLPSSSRQQVKISLNGAPLSILDLEEGWQTYAVDLPRSYLREGVNTMRFQYRYTASPLEVIPGSKDPRRLAVAFDYLILRPE